MSRTYRDMRLAAWRQVYDKWKWWYDEHHNSSMEPRELLRDEERAHPVYLWSRWKLQGYFNRLENRRKRKQIKQELRRLRR